MVLHMVDQLWHGLVSSSSGDALEKLIAVAGNTATLITNQPDIARWSKTKSGAMWSQLVVSRSIDTLQDCAHPSCATCRPTPLL